MRPKWRVGPKTCRFAKRDPRVLKLFETEEIATILHRRSLADLAEAVHAATNEGSTTAGTD